MLPLACAALAGLPGLALAAPSSCQQALQASLGQLGQAAQVLVVLSPRMPWALQEWPRMRAAAERAGFDVIALRDPQLPQSEWHAGVEAAQLPELHRLPALDAAAAVQCRLLNHAPSALVGRCGRIHPWPVLGVMPDGAWLAVLRQRREAIACS